jgi:hypothetical protein
MQGFEYHVDLVFCIDATGSMAPVIQTVKDNALRFHGDVMKALAESDRHVDRMRVKVIGFRDVYDNEEDAFVTSDFMELPSQETEFQAFVTGLRAGGGGDEPESGLEALAMAIKSDWTREGAKRRHVIVVWTDASAHPLEKSASASAGYPAGIPKSIDELTDLWEGQEVELSSKRLILFAPDAEPWSVIQGWTNLVWAPSRAGEGLDDLNYKEIVNTIVHSLG